MADGVKDGVRGGRPEAEARFNDDSRLGARVRRYAQVGTAMGGLAARLAGQRYLGLELDQTRHAADLKAALGGIKGPLMKVAQILSTIPDAIPEEYTSQLAELQANAPPMGWPFVKRRMTSELGPDWMAKFQSFEREAARAASLGQVHRAVHHDGRRLACKLQYPDMESAVEADLRQLKIVLSLYERYDSALSTSEIHAELAARLREELDYRLEARHMALYRRILTDQPDVVVPDTVPELSTGRLLTMTWLDGEPIMDFVDHSVEDRNALALSMFHAWYRPLYEYGVIHGDPHLGNYTVRADRGINLLDFGCIRVFRPAFVGGVIDLYRALLHNDEALAVHAYESWGFKGLKRETVEVLNIWARFIYGPLMEDRARPIQEVRSGQYGRETAAKVHRELKRLGGGITPPREFVFMDRAAVGLGSLFLRLRANLNWYALVQPMFADFDLEVLAARQRTALAEVGLSPAE